MASINKVIIIGNLGADPEMRYTPGGDAVASLSIATSEQWKDKNTGEKKERTEWHRVTAWRRLAEICGEYLTKGRQVYVEGKLQTDKWQDNNGNDRWTTKIIASDIRFLGSAPGGGSSGGRQQRSEYDDSGFQPPGGPDDDIPF